MSAPRVTVHRGAKNQMVCLMLLVFFIARNANTKVPSTKQSLRKQIRDCIAR